MQREKTRDAVGKKTHKPGKKTLKNSDWQKTTTHKKVEYASRTKETPRRAVVPVLDRRGQRHTAGASKRSHIGTRHTVGESRTPARTWPSVPLVSLGPSRAPTNFTAAVMWRYKDSTFI